MAILVVDDESSTRAVLREQLQGLGLEPILEAGDGKEALKIIQREKGQIKLLISDWEMPNLDGFGLAGEVAKLRDLDPAPFLLITSDLPRSKAKEVQDLYPRVDSHLIKPFRLKALQSALEDAAAHRARARSGLLYLGSPSASFLSALKGQKDSHWAIELRAQSLDEARAYLEKLPPALGAVVLDPALVGRGSTEWLRAFKRSPRGLRTLLVCSSRDPKEAFSLRTLAELFVPADADENAWKKAFARMSARLSHALRTEADLHQAKIALQSKDYKAALDYGRSLEKLDPGDPDVHVLLGDASLGSGSLRDAVAQFREAAELNPCLPRPYIKLFDLRSSMTPKERAELAELGPLYCPGNADVLLSAAKVFLDIGENAKAKELVNRVLVLDSTSGVEASHRREAEQLLEKC